MTTSTSPELTEQTLISQRLHWGIFLGILWLVLCSVIATNAMAQRAGDAVVFPAPGEPQVIHLDDHTKLTLLGTSYGYHHMAPHFENLCTANWIYTAANTTVVWIEEEHEPSKWPSYQLLVSDRANTGCVNIERRQGSFVTLRLP
jgi:hypothetical protein